MRFSAAKVALAALSAILHTILPHLRPMPANLRGELIDHLVDGRTMVRHRDNGSSQKVSRRKRKHGPGDIARLPIVKTHPEMAMIVWRELQQLLDLRHLLFPI